jgi:hypothetical protein
MVFVGQLLSTPYGVGKIVEKRANDLVIVPTTWELAYGQKPTFYMRETEVKPFFKVNDPVKTAYGTGKIDAIREEDGVYIVTLDCWALAQGQSPTLYLQGETLAPREAQGKFSVGDCVKSMYGVAIVTEIRSETSIVAVPTSWVLANNKPPVFFLNPNCCELVTSEGATGAEEATGDNATAAPKKKKSSCTIS